MQGQILLSLVMLAACSNRPPPSPDITNVPKVDGAQIAKVLARIKQEVGLFYSDGAKAERNWPALLSSIDAHPVCGDGHIAFQITSIKMDFEVVDDQSSGASGGLKIPFGPPAVGGSISPGLTGSKENDGEYQFDIYL